MAGESETLGAIRVKVEADLTKWNKDIEELKRDAETKAKSIEKHFSSTAAPTVKNNRSIQKSFEGIDAAILNNVSSTNQLIQINNKLFQEISKKTGKLQATYRILNGEIQKNVVGNVQGWQTIARVGETQLKKLDQDVIRSTYALNSMGRVVDSIPRGFKSVASSALTAASSFAIMNVRGNSFKGIMKSINQSLASGGGLVLGLGALTVLLERVSKRIEGSNENLNNFSLESVEASTESEQFAESLAKVNEELNNLNDRELLNHVTKVRNKIKELKEELLKIGVRQNVGGGIIGLLYGDDPETVIAQLKQTDAVLKSIYSKFMMPAHDVATDLIEKQKKVVEDIQKEVAFNEDQLIDKNKRLKAAEEELSRLRNLGIEKEEKKKNIVNETIQKLQTEIGIRELTYTLTKEILESTKATLEETLKLAKTDQERLKILEAMKKVNDQLKDFELEFEVIDEEAVSKSIEAGIVGGIEASQEFDKKRKEAIEQLKELQVTAIADEFAQREAMINLDYERKLAAIEELKNKNLISEEEYYRAVADLAKINNTELTKLQRERLSEGLELVTQIGQTLVGLFDHAGDSLLSKLNSVLKIIEDALGILNSITGDSFDLGSIGGIVEGIISILGFFGLKKGGSVVNTGSKVSVTPWSRVPRFARGVDDFIVPSGFPNDSFPIRVQSGERVTVTPAHEVPRIGGGGNTEGLLKELIRATRVISMNISRLELKVDVVNNAPDIQTQVLRNKKVESKLSRSGVKFNEQ